MAGDTAASGTRLTWFTHSILPEGGQIMTIQPETSREPRVTLDAQASQLLRAVLDEIARDTTLPFGVGYFTYSVH